MWINCFVQLVHGPDIMLVGGEGGKGGGQNIWSTNLLVDQYEYNFTW